MNTVEFSKILSQNHYSRSDLVLLLESNEIEELDLLMESANQDRIKFCGNEVHMRAIIDISNYCNQQCMYCGMREDNFSLERYRLEPDEIIELSKRIDKLGIGTLVLESGEDLKFDTDILAYLIFTIKQNTNLAITLNFGERGFDEYRTWKIAGADRYILKFETSNHKKYFKYRDKKLLNDRIQHLRFLKNLGYQIGSGNLIGLPNQTIEDIADDILLLNELDVDTAIIDVFMPIPFTSYQNCKSGDINLTIKTIALARKVLKNVHITSNLLKINTADSLSILDCGINAIMSSFTPSPYNTLSEILPKEIQISDPYENQKRIKKQIEMSGRSISYSRGDSLKKKLPINTLH